MQARKFDYVLNVQTTGLELQSGHRVIEVACLELDNNVSTDRYLHHYTNPEGKSSDAGALSAHGISDEYLSKQQTFSTLADEIIFFLADAKNIIIHNADFAIKFLDAEMDKAGKKDAWEVIKHNCHIIDSLKLARKIHPRHNGLVELAAEFKVISGDHDAGMIKVDLLAKLYPVLMAAVDVVQKSKLSTDITTNVSKTRAAFFSPQPVARHQHSAQAAAVITHPRTAKVSSTTNCDGRITRSMTAK